MWTRYFPEVEHARALIEVGAIGEVVLVQSDFFDPIYALQAAPLAFGATVKPTAIAAAGRNASAAAVAYGDDRCAVFTFRRSPASCPKRPSSSPPRVASPCIVPPTAPPG